MLAEKIRRKKGGAIILLIIMLTILFPIIISSIIDLSNIYRISKCLKNSLNASVKSASSRIDWTKVHDGVFLIDVGKAQSAFKDVMDSNLGINLSYNGRYFVYDNDADGKHIRAYMAVHNERHIGTFELFPPAGSVPPEVFSKPIATKVDRPTVFAVATADYRLMPLFGGKVIHITQFASSQLNELPQNKQPSANYTPPPSP